MKPAHASRFVVIALLLGCPALAQKIIQPWETPCSEELVKPNLEIKSRTVFSGELKDVSGAPLARSRVILRKLDPNEKFAEYRAVITDNYGHFDLGKVDVGEYRFLPGPNRGWKQPKEVQCWEGRECRVELIVQLNPSDQEFAGCPIQ